MARFENKVVFLTGGATGIGRATALAFAREGARIAVCDVAEESAQETVHLVNATGAKGIFIKTDVASAQEVEAAVRRTVAEFGGLHIGINNAGIEGSRDKATHEYDETMFRRVIDVNLTGVFLCKVVDANTLNYESEIVLKYQQFTSKYALTFHRPQPYESRIAGNVG